MAVNIATHIPIFAVDTISGNQDNIENYLEAASQTFKLGTPVELNGSANVIAWDGSNTARNILGVCTVGGYNYATAGAGAAPVFGQIGFPGGTPTFGSVPNQPSAVNLLHGSPFTTGMTNVVVASQDVIFEAMVDASSGATYNATTGSIGLEYGLTVDANGYWYVDLGKTTVGTNTVLTIQSLNPLDLVVGSSTVQINNGRVRFKFLPSYTIM